MTGDKSNQVNALAREGGIARARALTPQQRSEIARQAAHARWDRIDTSKGDIVRTISSYAIHNNDDSRIMRQTESDAMTEIWRKVQDHTESAGCPCDDCLDAVISEARSRFVSILTKIDNDAKLDKEEVLLFRLLTGTKPNRWTRVYREECRRHKKKEP